MELYAKLVKTEVVLERTGKRSYRMHLSASNKPVSPYKYAWGTKKHAKRKAQRWVKRYIKQMVREADRNVELSETWTIYPKPY